MYPRNNMAAGSYKNYYACYQQTTDLRHDTLTKATCYPLQQWHQILLRLYTALSSRYGNITAGHAYIENEVYARNVVGPVTPHHKIGWHLRIFYAQRFPHNFTRYLPRQQIRPNYLGYCKCTNNWNCAKSRAWHKILSTAVSKQIQPSGIHISWRHQHFRRILSRSEITIEYVYIIMQKDINIWKVGIKATGWAIRPDK